MKSKVRKFGMLSSIVLCLIMAVTAGNLLGADLYEVIQQAEDKIDAMYKGRANTTAKKDLDKIVDGEGTEDEKIKRIRERFLKVAVTVAEAVGITEDNATTELIDMSSLKWRIHSMEVIWKIDSSEDIVLSDATVEKVVDVLDETDTEAKDKKRNTHVGVDGKADVWISASKGKRDGEGSKDKKDGNGSESKQSWCKGIFDFSVKGGLNASIGVAGSASWDSSSSELWSRRSQETLTKGYDRLTKRIKAAKVSDCRLCFSISFENNWNKELVFDAGKVTVPVYAKSTHMVSASPVEEGILSIPASSVKTFEFQGRLDNSKSLRLLGFMRNVTPEVRIWEGQFTIESTDRTVRDAIDAARKNRTAPVACALGDELRFWNIRISHGGKPVTIEQAMWAVNGIYERVPFVFENGECVSVMGCATSGKDCTFSRYPVVRHNGKCLVGRLTKEQLGQRLGEDGVSFLIVDFTEKNFRDKVVNEANTGTFHKEALRLANDGDAPAQFFLGRMYYDGKGVQQDYSKAIEWYTKAAEQGNACAQYNLGNMYCNGEVVPQDYNEAVKWYRKAAEQGDAIAQNSLGVVLRDYGGGLPHNYTEAAAWFSKAAEHGNASAQCNLGVMYDKGHGVQQSYEDAAKWFRKAAEQGYAKAQFNLGNQYYKGYGVPQDYKTAAELNTKAAEQGDAEAQYCLGVMYFNGYGIPQDYKEAVRRYRIAAEQGNAMAQYNLGVMYYNAEGVPQDYKTAAEWFTKASEQGDAEAQFNLGDMYFNGYGVQQSNKEALKWYRKAAEQGHEGAKKRLRELGEY